MIHQFHSNYIHLFSGSVQFSHSVVSNSLRPHGLQHARPPCPSPTHGVYSNSCPLSQWCHPTISSSVVSFFSRLQSFPASGSFQMRQFFTSGGESIGISASASVLPMNIQHWFPYNGMFFEEIVAWPLPEKCTNSQTLLLKHWHFNNPNGESRDPDLHDCLFSRIWSKFLSENPCFFSEQIVLLEDQAYFSCIVFVLRVCVPTCVCFIKSIKILP